MFNISSTLFIKFIKIITLIRQVEFYIILLKTLFLLSLANINKLGVYYNNITNLLITLTSRIVLVV